MRVFAVLKEHIQADGGITSQLEAEFDFQCRIFWNAHLAWTTRIINKIPEHQFYSPQNTKLLHFKDSDIVKYESPNLVAIWRGSKKSMDTLYGPALGGGSLLYLGRKETNWENILRVDEWQEKIPFNFWFEGKRGWSLKSFVKFLKEEKINLRGLLYYLYTEIYGINWDGLKRRSKDLFLKLWGGGRDIYSSAWATAVETRINGHKIEFMLEPTKRNGVVLGGVKLKRQYEVLNGKIECFETISIAEQGIDGRFIPITDVSGPLSFQKKGEYTLKYQL